MRILTALLQLRHWAAAAFALMFHLVLATPALAQMAEPAARAHDEPALNAPLAPPDLPNDFKVVERGWLKLAYHVSQAALVEPLLAEAEAFKAEVTARLGRPVLQRVEVRLARDAQAMKAHAPLGAPYPPYAVGVAYSRIGLILLHADVAPNATGADPLKETFRHELAHVALYDASGGANVPLWFNEGVAIHLSRENAFARTQALWLATVAGKLMPISTLEQSFPNDSVAVPLAYAQSADLLRFLLRKEEQARFALLIRRLERGQTFDAALRDSYGMDQYSLEQLWRADVESRYTIWPILLGGSATSVLSLVLIGLAWRRKRQRESQAYVRWDREEHIEHARRLRVLGAHLRLVPTPRSANDASEAASAELSQASTADMTQRDGSGAALTEGAANADRPLANAPPLLRFVDSSLPKVKHDGDWHTIH